MPSSKETLAAKRKFFRENPGHPDAIAHRIKERESNQQKYLRTVAKKKKKAEIEAAKKDAKEPPAADSDQEEKKPAATDHSNSNKENAQATAPASKANAPDTAIHAPAAAMNALTAPVLHAHDPALHANASSLQANVPALQANAPAADTSIIPAAINAKIERIERETKAYLDRRDREIESRYREIKQEMREEMAREFAELRANLSLPNDEPVEKENIRALTREGFNEMERTRVAIIDSLSSTEGTDYESINMSVINEFGRCFRRRLKAF